MVISYAHNLLQLDLMRRPNTLIVIHIQITSMILSRLQCSALCQ